MKLKFSLVDDEIAISDSEDEISGEVVYEKDDDVDGVLLNAYEDSTELLIILVNLGVIEAVGTYLQETEFDAFRMIKLCQVLEDHGIEEYGEDG
ncbi:MAG: hypothetical protein AAFU78_22495 [Cyanobacteria bacterium J06633_2]